MVRQIVEGLANRFAWSRALIGRWSPQPIEPLPLWLCSALASIRPLHPPDAYVHRLTQAVWGLFFVFYACWLTAEAFSDGSLLWTTASLCGFAFLLTSVRYFASLRLKQIRRAPAIAPGARDSKPVSQDGAPSEPWFPKRRVRFVLLLSLAAVLIYFMGEVKLEWYAALLGLLTMLALHFAQTEPDFQPFRWWTLVILPLAGVIDTVAAVPWFGRAPITAISFGAALFCDAVLRPAQVRRGTEVS